MRCLQDVTPTPEQLSIVSRNKPGIEVIRGAAGSGKTTTALLRLRSLVGVYINRRQRSGEDRPVKILVLTYNKTLRGYIQELINQQIPKSDDIDLDILTFGKWARDLCGKPEVVSNARIEAKIAELRGDIGLPRDFLIDEVEYVLGRFMPGALGDYLGARRDGRGVTPRVERGLREEILQDVIVPYNNWLVEEGVSDWNGVAVMTAAEIESQNYDVVICDEAQDFSANQIRAIATHLAPVSSLTFVSDTAQRIYARGYTWAETGIVLQHSLRLKRNYRNTKEIAAFAASLISNVPVDDDFTMPDFRTASRDGSVPIILEGKYAAQVNFALDLIAASVDLEQESVAFLHPKGGGWFDHLSGALDKRGLEHVSLTRASQWPLTRENIALCTLHSAKGLEFDHVIILGLNDQLMGAWVDDTDHRLIQARKLLAMGIGRAKVSVIVGYKLEERSEIFDYFDNSTFKLTKL